MHIFLIGQNKLRTTFHQLVMIKNTSLSQTLLTVNARVIT